MQNTFHVKAIMFYSTLTLFSSTSSFAVDLNFEIGPLDLQTLPGNCGIGGVYGSLCGIGNGTETPDADTTPFYQGEIWINGEMYWHIIVGDPASGFAMENYTQNASGTGFGSFSGGEPANFGGLTYEKISGNGWDPLGIDPSRGVDFTGNGSGDPTRTIMRQVMGDGTWDPQTKTWNCDSAQFCSEFLKDSLVLKPVITQEINSFKNGVLMELEFQLDMSNSTYSDNTIQGDITNRLTFADLDIPSGDFGPGIDFDMATDTQPGRSKVTGGRYVYNDCANPSLLYGGSCWQSWSVAGGVNDYQEGSYTYASGTGPDPMSYDWGVYLDPDQNPFAGSGNKTKCELDNAPNSCQDPSQIDSSLIDNSWWVDISSGRTWAGGVTGSVNVSIPTVPNVPIPTVPNIPIPTAPGVPIPPSWSDIPSEWSDISSPVWSVDTSSIW